MFGTSATFNSVSAVFPISENDVWCAHFNNTNKVAVPRRGLNLAHLTDLLGPTVLPLPAGSRLLMRMVSSEEL